MFINAIKVNTRNSIVNLRTVTTGLRIASKKVIISILLDKVILKYDQLPLFFIN